MGSGSREYDFNQMADMGKAISDNKAALNDVRSNFVGPEQPREEAPVPTRVNLEATPEEMSRNSDVDKREKAYMAIRRLGEAGHDAANILLTPENIDKLSQWEDKAQRVEQARMAYEQDPKQYAMDSANQLDGYIKSWNLKNLSPEQRTGASPGIVNAAEMLNEAASAPAQEEVPSVDGNVSEGPGMVQRSEGGGEAPAPRGQSPRSENGPAHSSKVSSGGGSTKAGPASAAKIDVESLGNFNRVPPNPHKMASTGMSLDSGAPPEKGMASYEDPRMKAWVNSVNAEPEKPSKVGALKPGDKFFEMRGSRPDAPSGNVAYQETAAHMLPSVLAAAPAAAMLKEGVPGKLAEKVETELIPGAMNAGRKIASRLARKEAEPAAKAAQEVNNNISRVAKPPGLVKASLPPKPSRESVRQQVKTAEGVASKASPKPAFKSATEATHKASEYLEKKNASAASKQRTKENINQKKTQGKGQNL